jgi:carbonic anhydrase
MKKQRKCLLVSMLAVMITIPFVSVLPNKPESTHQASPAEALSKLMKGNERFISGKTQARRYNEERPEVAKGQRPYAIVLTCADSHVPPEILFDESLGKLFVVRVAGNVADPVVLGSIEYAVEHLHANLLMVLGHENCSAVKAAMAGGDLPPNVHSVASRIKPAVDKIQIRWMGEKESLKAAIRENVHYQMQKSIFDSDILSESVKRKELRVVGGVYYPGSGRVELISRDLAIAHFETEADHHTASSGKASAHAAPATDHHSEAEPATDHHSSPSEDNHQKPEKHAAPASDHHGKAEEAHPPAPTHKQKAASASAPHKAEPEHHAEADHHSTAKPVADHHSTAKPAADSHSAHPDPSHSKGSPQKPEKHAAPASDHHDKAEEAHPPARKQKASSTSAPHKAEVEHLDYQNEADQPDFEYVLRTVYERRRGLMLTRSLLMRDAQDRCLTEDCRRIPAGEIVSLENPMLLRSMGRSLLKVRYQGKSCYIVADEDAMEATDQMDVVPRTNPLNAFRLPVIFKRGNQNK